MRGEVLGGTGDREGVGDLLRGCRGKLLGSREDEMWQGGAVVKVDDVFVDLLRCSVDIERIGDSGTTTDVAVIFLGGAAVFYFIVSLKTLH